MGNCYAISSKTVSPQEDYGGNYREEDSMNGCYVGYTRSDVSCSGTLSSSKSEIGKKNKEDGSVCNKSGGGGVVRIRVVVTKEELKQILNNQGKDLSAEELMSELRLRRKRRRKVDEEIARVEDSWKPILESIPEDHLVNQ